MRLTWLNDQFICNELFAPFTLEEDNQYYEDLKEKLGIVLQQAISAGADDKSIQIIKNYRDRILSSIESYYKADLIASYTYIKELIKEVSRDSFAVNTLRNSDAFSGVKKEEIQFFRCRLGSPASVHTVRDMLHLPENQRAKTGNYRFSIPGNPSYYLSNTSYGCWIETGFPPEYQFNVSPVILDGTQKILNLAVSIRDFHCLNEFEENKVHCWLKLLMLAIATSYIIVEDGRTFKSEYVISQSIMIACKELGYDGVAYYSKRVSDEVFARCAINLALFVNYDSAYSNIIRHIKMDDPFNFALYRYIFPSLANSEYCLRATHTGFITNIGSYDRQYSYEMTEFASFDKFLFATWGKKTDGRGKDDSPWGISIN